LNGPPRVSLLMPVHNRAHLLDRVLDRLAENTTYEHVELIAVDDGSTDGSRDILRRWADGGRLPGMRVIEGTDRGAIASLNTALGAASGDLCVQLDDDVTVETRGWIERLLDVMLLDEAVGVVTGKVIFDSGELHACGVNVIGPTGWHERPTHPSEPVGRRQWINRIDGRAREGEGGEAEWRVAEVDSGIGCCMMYRRADALAVGGYDPEWSPVWFDDVDLCLKIRKLGRKVFYVPNVRAIHHFAPRSEPDSPFGRFSLQRLRSGLARRIVPRLPHWFSRAIESRVDVDLQGYYTKEQCARLRHHHAYWQTKWGWDARNPDMDAVLRQWGDSEICWATDPERRAAGERIVEAYYAQRPAPRAYGVAP
jgi:GT2 family glycosyltransferase